MKKILVGKKYPQFSSVNDEDHDRLSGFTWYLSKSHKSYYAYRYGHDRYKIFMHWDVIGVPPPGCLTDHVDRNGLNNQKNNLRFASRNDNARNTCINKRNTSGFRGVSWNKKDQRWRSRITINSKEIHLGSFKSVADAVLAYRSAAIKMHGKFTPDYVINSV